MNIYLDQGPTRDGNAYRGVGMYTRFLSEQLASLPELSMVKSVETADLIHYPYFDLFFRTLTVRSSGLRRQRCPVVVTIHDVIPLLFPKFYPRGLKGTLRLWQQKAALRRVAAVITDSKSSKRDITKHLGVPAKKVHVIYLSSNPNIHHSLPTSGASARSSRRSGIVAAVGSDKSSGANHSLKLKEPYILYVGDINYNKNLPQLIKALKYLPEDLQLVCAGRNFHPQPISEWREIETQCALSDVEKRVHFVTDFGDNPDSFLSQLYSQATCYVQPSLYEGFGLPVLEAMQCRTPVVSTHNSSLIEVGGHHVEYSASPEARDLAQAIKVVLGWSITKRAHRVASAERWASTFTWQKAALETAQVYTSLLQSKKK